MAYSVAAAQQVTGATAGRIIGEGYFNNDNLNAAQLTALRAFIATLTLPAGANPSHITSLTVTRSQQTPGQVGLTGSVFGVYADANAAIDDLASGKLANLVGRVP